MRKMFLLVFAFYITNAIAQNPIINPSFETWTFGSSSNTIEYPDSWGSPILLPVYKSTDACNGNYSALLTDSVHSIGAYVIQSVIWTGVAPSGISFCYKFDHKLGDSAYFQATLEDQGTSGYTSSVNIGFNQDKSNWTSVLLNFATYTPISGTFKLSITATCFQPFIGPIDYSYFKLDNIDILYPVGVNENKLLEDNSIVFPNPTDGIVNINFNNEGLLHYEITDAIGKVILKDWVINDKAEIDLSQYDNGIYFIKAYDKTENTFAVKKLIKK